MILNYNAMGRDNEKIYIVIATQTVNYYKEVEAENIQGLKKVN